MSKGFRVSRQIGRDKYNSFVTRYESFVKPSTWTQLTGANGASNRVSAPPRLNIFSIESSSILIADGGWMFSREVWTRRFHEAGSRRDSNYLAVADEGKRWKLFFYHAAIRRKSWGRKLRIILEKYGGRRVGTVVDGSTNTRFVAYTCTRGV